MDNSGTVEISSFPAAEGEIPKSQFLQLPTLYGHTKPGRVCTMQWSSDGYALAVGWNNGWAVWSVGGRCLACSFGLQDDVDNERCETRILCVFVDIHISQLSRHFYDGLSGLGKIL